jgi:hypothetical protein
LWVENKAIFGISKSKSGRATMPEMSPGAALRELQQAHSALRKGRELLKQVRDVPEMPTAAFAASWECLTEAYRRMSVIPREALDEPVLTKHLAVGRYATALLVRLRRLHRHKASDPGAARTSGGLDEDDGE